MILLRPVRDRHARERLEATVSGLLSLICISALVLAVALSRRPG